VKPRLKPLAEQVIVITGASSGIGLVTARRAAAAGAKVMLVARNADALGDAVRGIEATGGNAAWFAADAGEIAEVRAAAAAAVERFGRIDTWVNNAGVAIYAALVDTPLDEHRQLFRTNYFGAVHGALIAVQHLQEKGGALITIGSVAGDMPSPVMGAYSASKHAVKGFIESLRIELNTAGAPISVTLIKPSGIDTPVAEHAAVHVDGEALIPPPVYDPELVAGAILDAAQHPRVNVTVGGGGRLQVLAATHFPGLFARLGGAAAAVMVKPDASPTPGNNLHAPVADGRERSRRQSGRSVSLYTPLARHKLAVAAVGVLGAAAALAIWRRSSKSDA
jgi:short-subunit dehydrogenase